MCVTGLFIVISFFTVCLNLFSKPAESTHIFQKETIRNSEYIHPYTRIADSLFNLSQLDASFDEYERALHKFIKERDEEGKAKCLNKIALKYQLDNKYDTAIFILQNNLKSIIENLDNKHIEVANAHFLLGVCYDLKFDVKSSIGEHQIALELRQGLFGENHKDVAESYNGIGELYLYALQDYYSAENFFRESIEILETLKIEDKKPLAKLYYNLATAYRLQEDIEKAMIYCARSLNTYLGLNRNTINNQVNCYGLLAAISHDKGDFNEASSFYLQAINQLQRLEKLNIYQQNLLSTYQEYTGVVLTKKNDYDSAKIYLDQAIKSYKQLDNKIGISSAYLNRGIMYMHLNKFDSALKYMRNSVDIRKSIVGEKHPFTSHSLRYTGDLYDKYNQHDSALVYYHRAVLASTSENFKNKNVQINPIEDQLNNNDALLKALYRKGTCLMNLYNQHQRLNYLTFAMECFDLAFTMISNNYQSFEQEGSKLFLLNEYDKIYGYALECYYKLFELSNDKKYIELAFTAMEESKARIIYETLHRLQKRKELGLPDSLVYLENKLKAQYAFIMRGLISEQQKEVPNSETIKNLEKELFGVTEKQDSFNQLINKVYPRYSKYKVFKKLELTDVEKSLTKEETMMFNFYWGEKNVYLITLDKTAKAFLRFDTNKLEERVKEFLSQLLKGPQFSNGELGFQKFCDNAYFLYKTVFQLNSITEEKSFKKLVVVPDGLLQFIPIEALIQELPNENEKDYNKLNYALYNYQVSYAYSLSTWLRETETFKKKNVKFLAFGYGEDGGLPGTEKELNNLSKRFDGNYYLGQTATEVMFKNTVPDVDIVHMAIHGISDNQNYWNSRLLFRQSSSEAEDGVLYLSELYGLKTKARLVVLSSCDSGVGIDQKGEGVYSIARAFLYAGCPTTIMSLWKISDKTTPLIIDKFYYNISKGKRIDESLRIAKLNYLKTSLSNEAHPSNWAALVVQGSPNNILNPSRRWELIACLMLISALLIFIILTKSKS